MEVSYELYILSKYQCFLINEWIDIGKSQKIKISLFKGVQGFDLQPPGEVILGFGVRMSMPTLQGNYMVQIWMLSECLMNGYCDIQHQQ